VQRRVGLWRQGGYQGVTRVTRRLLDYRRHPERDKKLFFCQLEAVETVIYLAEVANKYGDTWIENYLRQANADANPLLYRIACKMATGTGKTVVMAMLIAWQALNKLANPQDPRFSDAFLIVTPGITIRDRLHVLLPNDPDNYYRQRDIIPPDDIQALGKAKTIITNFHAFLLRERFEGARLTKAIATAGQEAGATKETPDEMVRRVCWELWTKRNIVVINAEAHPCYRRRVGGYEKYYRQWESRKQGTPPVCIIVCSNTNVSKLVYDYVAGSAKLRGHRSEAELDCPDLRALADVIILNAKRGWPALANQGRLLRQWGWA
jgi:type III restriction enzyme